MIYLMSTPHRVRFLLNYDSDNRPSEQLAVTTMPKYSLDEIHGLDHDASTATHAHQTIAVALVASILDRNLVPYAVTGAMNFYLRGSKRMSGPITIAVNPDGRSKREFLDLFAGQPRYVRPSGGTGSSVVPNILLLLAVSSGHQTPSYETSKTTTPYQPSTSTCRANSSASSSIRGEKLQISSARIPQLASN